jgi:S1-C subfamily serine protease
MADLALESQKSVQTDRAAAEAAQKWYAGESALWSGGQKAGGDAGTVKLPTLHLGDDKLNVYDAYSVNSDIAQLYIKNRPAIVRINTLDPRTDGSFSVSAGSGSIIDPSGIIATGYHVVKEATTLRVKTADGTIYAATLLAADPAKDEALLQINTSNPFKQFPTVELAADSRQAQPGEALVGLGFPRNQDAMHVSMLTADKRLPLSDLKVTGGLLLVEDKDRALIKTDGPVSQGDSGGPVFDRRTGEQIGIVNLNDGKNGNAYITPVEDLQLFMARVKEKYGIASLPVKTPGIFTDQPSAVPPGFQPGINPVNYVPGLGMWRLERSLSETGR